MGAPQGGSATRPSSGPRRRRPSRCCTGHWWFCDVGEDTVRWYTFTTARRRRGGRSRAARLTRLKRSEGPRQAARAGWRKPRWASPAARGRLRRRSCARGGSRHRSATRCRTLRPLGGATGMPLIPATAPPRGVASVEGTEAVRALRGRGSHAVSAGPAPDLQLILVLRALRLSHDVRGARVILMAGAGRPAMPLARSENGVS
jgi:hypothetical protein